MLILQIWKQPRNDNVTWPRPCSQSYESQAWDPMEKGKIFFFHNLETVVFILCPNGGHSRVRCREVSQVLGNTAGLSPPESLALQMTARPQEDTHRFSYLILQMPKWNLRMTEPLTEAQWQVPRTTEAPLLISSSQCCFHKSLSGL